MGRVECTDAGVTLAEQGPQVEDQLLRHRPRLKKPPSGGSNFGAASASPPSRFERLTSLKPPALPGDIYLIQEVLLDQKRSRGEVWVKIIWQTGAVSEHRMLRRVHSYNDDYADLDYLRDRIIQLNAEGLMDKQVAAVLNEEGVVSARQRPFTYENVWVLRKRWGLPAVKLNPIGANPPQWPDGSYSVQGAAAAVGVTTQVIFDYLTKGLLTGRQIAKGQPWQIDLTTEQIDRLRQRLLRTKRSRKVAS